MDFMKYIIFFSVALFGIPLGYKMAKNSLLVEKILFTILILLTVKMIDINFVSRETFRITTRGFEIGMVDIFTMIFYYLNRSRKEKYPLTRPPGFILFILYILFSALSMVNSEVVLFSLFELSKMVRMLFFFYVMYNYIQTQEQIKHFMFSVGIAILYITIVVLQQRYIYGLFQTPGPFPHQNSLVMYMILFNSLLFSYILNGDPKFPVYWLGVFGGGVVVILATLSRAGMVLFSISIMIVMFLSVVTKPRFKTFLIIFLSMIMGLAVLAKAWDTIVERFETAPEESTEVRVVLAQAALKMVADKKLGIGLNNFGVKINPPWNYSDHIEHEKEGVKNGLVETVYLMIAAECGWHTLIIFMLFLFYIYSRNLVALFRLRNTVLAFLPIGFLGGLSAIYVESTLEWVLKQTNNFYQLMLVAAISGAQLRITADLAKKKGEDNGEKKQR